MAAQHMLRLVNRTKQRRLASEVLSARTWWARTRGLIGRPPLPSGTALWLQPCHAVHTACMHHPLTVVFLDAQGLVLTRVDQLTPWRWVRCPGACVAVEFGAGNLPLGWAEPGDLLELTEEDAAVDESGV